MTPTPTPTPTGTTPSGASCGDNVKNGSETDVDCGGTCAAKCALGKACGTASDCASGVCAVKVCASGSVVDAGTDADADADAGTDAGGPPVAGGLTNAAVDLGPGDCGGAAVTKTVTINNTGGKVLTISATTSGAPFSVSPATLTISPNVSGTLTLSVSVPATSVAATPLTGTVTVTTNDPGKATTTIPVSVTPQGATFAFTGTPTTAAFGTKPINKAATAINLTLKNTGNKAATVTFGAPSNAQFSLSSTPASGASIAANGTVAIAAGFTPTALTATSATSNIAIGGAACGTSATTVAFSGQGTVGAIAGWPTQAIDFGKNPCGGAAPAAKTFTLTNTGSASVTITAVNVGVKGYTTDLLVGTVIAPAAAKIVTVTAPAIAFPSLIPGDVNETLSIVTDIPGDTQHNISLTEGALGAILAFDTSETVGFGNFGNIPVGTSATAAFKVTNAGNAPANVTTVTAAPFGVSQAGFTIAAGAGAVPATQGLSATFTPATTLPVTGTVGITATGLCAALPNALPLAGTGQNGGISLSTNGLAFSANCNDTAAAKSFTIKNSGNVAMTWTAALNRGVASPYALDLATATLAPDAESVVTVTPSQIPQYPADISPAAFADDLLITTDIVNDVDHHVSLSETALGGVLSFQPSTVLAFGELPVNTTSAPQTLTVVNSGNAGTVTNVTFSSDNAKFAIATAAGAANPGTPFSSDVTFAPGASVTLQNGNLNVATVDVLCAPLPAARAATGTGTLAQVVYSPATVNFGNVNCGATAPKKTVTISNPGNQDFTVTSVTLQKATYFTFTMTPASGLVPKNNGGTVEIELTAKAIPQVVPSVPDSGTYSDVLTFKTDAADDLVDGHPIDVKMGAQGVILRPIVAKNWDFGSINYGATGYYNVGLRNDGNVPVIVSLSEVSLPVFGMSGTTIPSGSGAVLSGMFTPASASQTYNDTGKLTVPAETVFCQPMPNYDLTLTGKGASGTNIYLTGGLAFPAVDCNAAANAPQNVTIHNTGNTPATYMAGLNNGTWYTVSGAGTVPANGTAVVTVTPKQITTGTNTYSGSSTYADQLLVIIDGVSYPMPVSQSARGSDISAYWNSYGYSYYGNPYYTGSLCAQNTGNFSASITSKIADARWTITNNPLNLTPNAGYSCQSTEFREPNASGGCFNYIGTFPLTVTTSGTVCHTDIPASIAWTGYACP